MSLVAVALGGNALIRSGEGTVAEQRRRIRETRDRLAVLADRGDDLLVTHGNGPQVGNRLLAEEGSEGPAEPLDVLVAETQAQVGYLLQSGLGDRFGGPPVPVVTRVRVDPDDPDFDDPSKPVGPYYTAEEATDKPFETTEVHHDGGTAHRRVVPSPGPVEVLEADRIESLVADGKGPVICGGGGGVPVVPADEAGGVDVAGGGAHSGDYAGVPAVVDKDHTTRLLAEAVGADCLLLLTDVDAAYRDFGGPEQEPIREATPSTLRDLAADGEFAAGSMRPKVAAAADYVAATGNRALVTSPAALADALDGDAGTQVVPE